MSYSSWRSNTLLKYSACPSPEHEPWQSHSWAQKHSLAASQTRQPTVSQLRRLQQEDRAAQATWLRTFLIAGPAPAHPVVCVVWDLVQLKDVVLTVGWVILSAWVIQVWPQPMEGELVPVPGTVMVWWLCVSLEVKHAQEASSMRGTRRTHGSGCTEHPWWQNSGPHCLHIGGRSVSLPETIGQGAEQQQRWLPSPD